MHASDETLLAAPRRPFAGKALSILLVAVALSGVPVSADEPKKDPEKDKRPAPPSTKRVVAGKYTGSFAKEMPSVLLSKQAGSKERWKRLAPEATVSTSDLLMALPGYNAVITTSRGVALQLHGHVREFSLYPQQQNLAESRVVLHENDRFDLDLTLLRGRIYLRRTKADGAVKVRLRFAGEVWDLSMEKAGTEVGIDLLPQYPSGADSLAGEEPLAEAVLCLFKGEIDLKTDPFHTMNLEVDPPKVKVVFWDSEGGASDPKQLPAAPLIWEKKLSPAKFPEARRAEVKKMQAALKGLEKRLSGKKSVDVALKESLVSEDVPSRLLAIYSLSAIDDDAALIDVLGDDNPEHRPDRLAAIETLRLWLARGAGHGKLLYDPKKGTGLLIDKKYKPAEARNILALLHDFTPIDAGKPETYEFLARMLKHKRTAIAELGYFHLSRLAHGAKLPRDFNAAAPLEARENYSERINDLIAKKKLPPPNKPEKKKEEEKKDK